MFFVDIRNRRAVARALAMAVLAVALPACHQDTGILERNFACSDDNECIEGHLCHPGQRVCVVETSFFSQTVELDRVRVEAGGELFMADRLEVKVRDYAQCVDRGPCAAPTCSSFSVDSPVHCVNWNDARTYCSWIGGRLPLAREWRLAAIGDNGWRYPWGDAPEPNCERAVVADENSTGCGEGRPATVSSQDRVLGASPFGALDMIGNVWEWVGNTGTSSCSVDPCPDLRSALGGSFTDTPSDGLFVVNGNGVMQGPGFSSPDVGFRCIGDL